MSGEENQNSKIVFDARSLKIEGDEIKHKPGPVGKSLDKLNREVVGAKHFKSLDEAFNDVKKQLGKLYGN